MHPSTLFVRAVAAAALCAAPGLAASAADEGEVAELRRAVEALRAQNQALAERLSTLEAQQRPERPQDRRTATAASASASATTTSGDAVAAQPLEQRVRELEAAKVAQEDAVRSIIKDSVSTLGSKINEAVSFSGTLGATVGRVTDFSGERRSSIGLDSTSFEFEIQTNDWSLGHIKLDYLDSRDPTLRPAQAAALASGVDRLSVDTAYISVGNPLKFPPQLTAGRMVLPFGISTGHPVADVLSLNSPLTVDVFEMRQDAVSLSLAFPTPALKPATPPVTAPPVTPMVIHPLLASLGGRFGYRPPPARLKPLPRVAFTPEAAPYNVGVFLFDGRTPGSGLRKHWGATAGYQTRGHCGRRYEEISGIGLCPWAVNVDLSYVSSVFSSRFLQAEYDAFLGQIGRVPGLAASVKASLGPFAFVGEWNGATRQARFTDDIGDAIAIKPSAWQVSLGYQLGWNAWVQEIGAQGTYVSIGYSQSRDLAGATRLVGTTESRVGTVPRRRLLLTAGEWVLSGLRVVVEYSRNWDYPETDGGTGRSSNGLFTSLTYVW